MTPKHSRRFWIIKLQSSHCSDESIHQFSEWTLIDKPKTDYSSSSFFSALTTTLCHTNTLQHINCTETSCSINEMHAEKVCVVSGSTQKELGLLACWLLSSFYYCVLKSWLRISTGWVLWVREQHTVSSRTGWRSQRFITRLWLKGKDRMDAAESLTASPPAGTFSRSTGTHMFIFYN